VQEDGRLQAAVQGPEQRHGAWEASDGGAARALPHTQLRCSVALTPPRLTERYLLTDKDLSPLASLTKPCTTHRAGGTVCLYMAQQLAMVAEAKHGELGEALEEKREQRVANRVKQRDAKRQKKAEEAGAESGEGAPAPLKPAALAVRRQLERATEVEGRRNAILETEEM